MFQISLFLFRLALRRATFSPGEGIKEVRRVYGKKIVDFYCHKAKLVVELDGSQHYENAGQISDAVRDAYLKQQGLTVLRIPNNAIKENFRGVCEEIWNRIEPSP